MINFFHGCIVPLHFCTGYTYSRDLLNIISEGLWWSWPCFRSWCSVYLTQFIYWNFVYKRWRSLASTFATCSSTECRHCRMSSLLQEKQLLPIAYPVIEPTAEWNNFFVKSDSTLLGYQRRIRRKVSALLKVEIPAGHFGLTYTRLVSETLPPENVKPKIRYQSILPHPDQPEGKSGQWWQPQVHCPVHGPCQNRCTETNRRRIR